MNKTELVASVAEKSGISKKDAEKAVNAVIDSIVEAVSSGDKVQVIGFGRFEARDRKEKKSRNPRTKEEIIIPATRIPVFKAGSMFKESVAK